MVGILHKPEWLASVWWHRKKRGQCASCTCGGWHVLKVWHILKRLRLSRARTGGWHSAPLTLFRGLPEAAWRVWLVHGKRGGFRVGPRVDRDASCGDSRGWICSCGDTHLAGRAAAERAMFVRAPAAGPHVQDARATLQDVPPARSLAQANGLVVIHRSALRPPSTSRGWTGRWRASFRNTKYNQSPPSGSSGWKRRLGDYEWLAMHAISFTHVTSTWGSGFFSAVPASSLSCSPSGRAGWGRQRCV